MTGSRSGLNSRRDPEWKKRKKEAAWGLEMVLNFLFSVLMIAGSASAWEEGDDAVNVISVENMDELLGLRMVTELKSFEGIRANGTGFEFLFGKANKETEKESRLKRMIKSRKTHAAYSKVQDFCSLPQCNCTIEKGESQMDCNFQNKEVCISCKLLAK